MHMSVVFNGKDKYMYLFVERVNAGCRSNVHLNRIQNATRIEVEDG